MKLRQFNGLLKSEKRKAVKVAADEMQCPMEDVYIKNHRCGSINLAGGWVEVYCFNRHTGIQINIDLYVNMLDRRKSQASSQIDKSMVDFVEDVKNY